MASKEDKVELRFLVFLIASLTGLACHAAVADPPLACRPAFKDRISKFVAELEKSSPATKISEVKKSEPADLIKFHLSYGMDIRNKWIYGKEPYMELLNLYKSAGFSDPEAISQDLIEDLWISESSGRCQQFLKYLSSVKPRADLKVEDITEKNLPNKN